MFKRFLVAVSVLTTLALPSPSLADAKMDDLLTAAKAAGACQREMPNSRNTTAALKAEGFQTVEANGFIKAFADKSRKVVVLITTEQNGRVGCLISASGMSVTQARALIQPWLQVANPKIEGTGQRPFSMGWIGGTFKGGPVELLIREPDNIILFRGAAIIARTPV